MALLGWLRLRGHGADEDVVQRSAASDWGEGGGGLEGFGVAADVPVVEAAVVADGE
jgi:hypothetical protein